MPSPRSDFVHLRALERKAPEVDIRPVLVSVTPEGRRRKEGQKPTFWRTTTACLGHGCARALSHNTACSCSGTVLHHTTQACTYGIVNIKIYLSISLYLSIYLSTQSCLSTESIYPLSIYLSIYLSILSIYLSIYHISKSTYSYMYGNVFYAFMYHCGEKKAKLIIFELLLAIS